MDYEEHFAPSPIREPGKYVLQVASIDGSGYTYSKHQTFYVVANPNPQPIWPNDTTLIIRDQADNDSIIAANNGSVKNVMLARRILPCNGHWNTLCLPFDVTLSEDNILKDADVRALTSATFEAGTLTLNFPAENVVTALSAGVPYIVRWTNPDKNDIVSPTFRGVTVKDTVANAAFPNVHFLGSYSAVNLTAGDDRKLYLSDGDTLYYPSADMVIGACRAHFALSDGTLAPQRIVLNFDGDATDLSSPKSPFPSGEGWGEAVKFLRNGQLYIRKDGILYDALGRKINKIQ